jgi:HAD superfamily phosphatase (TIGR01668 family)
MTRDHLLQPNLVIHGPILALRSDQLVGIGLRGLILDVDETLVSGSTRQVSQELLDWIHEIRQHLKIWLVSNNLNHRRIAGIARALDLPYFLGAGKPSRQKLRQAIERMQLPQDQVAMVGDRLFTDVLAGNRLGLFTILVEPMIDPACRSRRYWWRDLEVYISQALGATFHAATQPATIANWQACTPGAAPEAGVVQDGGSKP